MLRLPEAISKGLPILLPIDDAAEMIARPMSAAMSEYSIDVEPL